MEPMRLGANELAAALHVSPNRISAIIDERQPHTLTSDIALRLARRFRTSPKFWLGLQNAYSGGFVWQRDIDKRVKTTWAAKRIVELFWSISGTDDEDVLLGSHAVHF